MATEKGPAEEAEVEKLQFHFEKDKEPWKELRESTVQNAWFLHIRRDNRRKRVSAFLAEDENSQVRNRNPPPILELMTCCPALAT
jgi:hypothetical protein